MKKILPFICTMFISFSAWGVTCDAGYYLPDGADECVICPAGKYSAAGASSCSNVTAGYFCSGGCTTATPTSSSDCLTGNTCGKCTGRDATTNRLTYSYAGAASCSVCPAVTGDLASRVKSYGGWWSNDIHNAITGCAVGFYDDDPDATYTTGCYYSSTDGAYGGPNSNCQTFYNDVSACAAGKYNPMTSGQHRDYKGVDSKKGQICIDTDAGYYSPDGAKTQTACPAGTYSAAGAASCSIVTKGYYTTGCTNGTTCTGQSQCTGTTYCADGVQYSCPTGYTENTTDGKSSVTQCQTTCPAGNYMASGTYTQLEYLQSSGTQYIDTGVVFLFGDEFLFEYMPIGTLSGENKGYGAGVSAETNLTSGGRRYNNKVSMYFRSSHNYYTPELLYNNTLNNRYIENWKIDTSTGKLSSVLTDVTNNLTYQLTASKSAAASYNSRNSIYLWRDNNLSYNPSCVYPSSMRIYSTWLKRANGAMAMNLVPVRRNSDNTLGMLDLVSGKFLTNAGTGTFIAGPDVGLIGGTCSAVGSGYYAAATTIGYGTPAPQTACPLNTYSASGAASCTACPAGTFAPTASPVCYPHILHVGNDVVYVRSTKLTTPSLNIDIDRDGVADFFVNMTTTRTRMNKDSTHYFHAQWGNNDYYICDDTTCPGME